MHADVRTGGGKLVASAQAPTEPGEGELALGAPLPPGRYSLTLRLTTAHGAAALTAAVDTRTVLPRAQARAVLDEEHGYSDGDEGVKFGECRYDAPRRVWCMLRAFKITSDLWRQPGVWGEASIPAGGATATLRNDGLHVGPATYLRDHWRSAAERMSLAGTPQQHAGRQAPVALTVRTKRATRATLTVTAHWRTAGGRTARQAVTLRSDVTPRHPWKAQVALGARAAMVARAGRRVTADVTVSAAWPSRFGPELEPASDDPRHPLTVALADAIAPLCDTGAAATRPGSPARFPCPAVRAAGRAEASVERVIRLACERPTDEGCRWRAGHRRSWRPRSSRSGSPKISGVSRLAVGV